MANLPTGTVVFLFTDVEGSTQRWEQHPESMKAAIARHDAILRGAIEANGGRVFKTVGDAFCAAFGTVPPAVTAALAAQLALQRETWGEVGAIRVRMALHVGAGDDSRICARAPVGKRRGDPHSRAPCRLFPYPGRARGSRGLGGPRPSVS